MSEHNETAAFPLVSQGGVHEHQFYQIGLSKRELLAAMAMQGCRSRNSEYASWEDMARDSVEIADALLAELAKEPQA